MLELSVGVTCHVSHGLTVKSSKPRVSSIKNLNLVGLLECASAGYRFGRF
jgi:hypothetical protein